MESWVQIVLTSIVSVAASSGFWAFMTRKSERGTAATQLLMGLAYIELTSLGMNYIKRGTISRDEYEDLRKYFYEPYKALGGNGVAERVMNQVDTLMLVSQRPYAQEFQMHTRDGEYIDNGRIITRPEEATARGS